MKLASLTPSALTAAGIGAYFRPRDLASLGVGYPALQRLVTMGVVEKVAAGLYRLSQIEPNEFETIAMVAAAVPDAIVCLLSALRLHELGTQSPHEIWLALDRKARKPARLPAKVRLVRFSGAMLSHGVETLTIHGAPVRVTSAARTVVDCFRYRNKLGLDVALEALRDAVRNRKVRMDEITRSADACRARTVMAPYLEALAE